MAAMRIEMVLTVVAAAALWSGATADDSGCANTFVTLTPCLSFISGKSSSPASACCQQLSSMAKSKPQCVCEAMKGGAAGSMALGVKIDQRQLMALPKACGTQVPAKCSGGSSPSSSPSMAPLVSDAMKNSPLGSEIAGKESGEGAPSSGGDSSDGSQTKLPLSLLFLTLLIASCASTFLVFV